MREAKPWLVGESNPYQPPGADLQHRFDLYHEPPHSAGGRLCRFVLGLEPHVYRASFVRRNLLAGKWSALAAAKAAVDLDAESGAAPLILLGAKVARAFGFDFVPFSTHQLALDGKHVAILPHPSGLSRAWLEPSAVARARAAVVAVAPHLRGVLGAEVARA